MIKLIDSILSVLFPTICAGCGVFGDNICARCIDSLEYIEYSICPVCTRRAIDGATHPRCRNRYTIDGLVSIYRFNGPIRTCIKKLKYKRAYTYAPFLSKLMIPALYQNSSLSRFVTEKTPVLVPIPIHWWRGRRRSFNQSELLARELGERTGWTIEANLLKRSRYTSPQAGLKRSERIRNTKGIFAVNRNPSFPIPAYVILIDDVWTTGATLRMAANVLKRAGVKTVWGVTVAR